MIGPDKLTDRLLSGDLLTMSEIREQVSYIAAAQKASAQNQFAAISVLAKYIKEKTFIFTDITSNFVSPPHTNMIVES